VVLHLGDDDLVARADPEAVTRSPAAARRAIGEGIGDQVDRLGGVLGEDDLVGTAPMKPAIVARAAS
jgi:hypothetical protein